MKHIKLMLSNAFQTNKESLSIHQGSWGMMLASPSYPKRGCHWKDQPLNQLELLCLSVPFAPLASYFFSAFTDINNLSIRMFGCQRKLINASFMDCSMMETRKVCTPPDRKGFKKPWNAFSGIFGICKCQESRFFSCQLSQCDSQLEPSALHLTLPAASLIFHPLPVADSTVPPCIIAYQYLCSSKRLQGACTFFPGEIFLSLPPFC